MTRRRLTRDKALPQIVAGKYYTIEQLGPKQSLTPEGFLLCEEVPLARPGSMLYGPDELPITTKDGSPVVITRDAATLFRPETLASASGKAVTNEHPDDDVVPKNYKKHLMGVVLNPRKGTDDNAGLLVGDLLIYDEETIADVRNNKREVSLGYDADYDETGPGEGRQLNILVNHVALVERGRCGPRCAIGDQETVIAKEQEMAIIKGLPARRRLKVADAKARIKKFMDEGEALLSDLDDGFGDTDEGNDTGPGDSGDQHIHVHLGTGTSSSTPAQDKVDPLAPNSTNMDPGDPNGPGEGGDDPVEARFQALEAGHAQILQALAAITQKIGATEPPAAEGEQPPPAAEAPPADEPAKDAMADLAEEAGTEPEEAAKFKDSAPLEDSVKETLALAEILVPGFRMPTYDSKSKPRDTMAMICSTRRKVLDAAYMTQNGKQVIDTVYAGKTFDTSKMSCAAVRSLFKGAAGAQKLLNNQGTRDNRGFPPGFLGNQTPVDAKGFPTKVQSIDDLNALNKAYYKSKAAVGAH